MKDMTEIRHDAAMGVGCAVNLSAVSWWSHARDMVENFDEMEKKLIDSNNRYADLQLVCDDQDKQIAALKAACIEKQYRLMPTAPRCYNDARRKAAIEELARGLPEIDWEDMK